MIFTSEPQRDAACRACEGEAIMATRSYREIVLASDASVSQTAAKRFPQHIGAGQLIQQRE